jgi:ribosomal protein S18 acetylase RimI-like enzyme
MTPPPFRFEPLNAKHDRSGFRCGEPALDRYFHELVTQDVRRLLAKCFVAIDNKAESIAAFYTLSAASIPLSELPAAEARRLPRYPTLPAVRIGRLAVDERFHGRGLGGALLMNAAHRSLANEAAAFALLVDAKNERAVAFYRHHGFKSLISTERTLFIPLSTIQKALLSES